jgi:hypothetical protein
MQLTIVILVKKPIISDMSRLPESEPKSQINRREFIKLAIWAAGAVSGIGLGYGLRKTIYPPEPPFPEMLKDLLNSKEASISPILAAKSSPEYDLDHTLESLPQNSFQSAACLSLRSENKFESFSGSIISSQKEGSGNFITTGFTTKHTLDAFKSFLELDISQPHRPDFSLFKFSYNDCGIAVDPYTDFGVFTVKTKSGIPVILPTADNILTDCTPSKNEKYYGISYPVINDTVVIQPLIFDFYFNALNLPSKIDSQTYASLIETSKGSSGAGIFSKDGKLSYICTRASYSATGFESIPGYYPDLIRQSKDNLQQKQ